MCLRNIKSAASFLRRQESMLLTGKRGKVRVWIPAFAGMTPVFVVLLSFLSINPAHAADKLVCDLEKTKVLEQAEEANVCHEDADCMILKMYDCNDGCATLPIHKYMEKRMSFAIRSYNEHCGDCKANCKKVASAKCLNGKCDLEFRDWKYLSKDRQ